jgi:hypothetical protein
MEKVTVLFKGYMCLSVFIMFFYFGCSSDKTEKYQNKRNNTTNVHDRIKELEMEDVLISSLNRLYIIKDCLLICDHNTTGEQIHFFNKDDFTHITSIAPKGQGPGEIVSIGAIAFDEVNNLLYVTDHGKQRIFSYELDSAISNPHYRPGVKMEMDKVFFPSWYRYINDTLSIGIVIELPGNSNFNQCVAKLNMKTGEIKKMKYVHPRIEKKRVSFAVSVENGIYAEGYSYHDLMTLCTLDGELKCNIYGRRWDDKKSNRLNYFGHIAFCNDRIFALYSEGAENFSDNPYPDRFLVFNLSGDYIQTLETNYQITDFCFDKENNRIIMSMNDEIQFAYMDMDGLIE